MIWPISCTIPGNSFIIVFRSSLPDDKTYVFLAGVIVYDWVCQIGSSVQKMHAYTV